MPHLETKRLRGRGAVVALGVSVLLTAVALPAQAKVLAKVNGVEISDDDVKTALDDLGSGLPRQLEGKARENYVLDFLIDEQLVVQKAQRDKLGESPDFAKKLAYLRDKALMESLLGKIAKDAVTEDAIKKTYDEAAKNQKPETEVHAHHILVPTEDEAKAALKRVKGGEDFGKVADEVSKDPGARGGDLGWFTKDRMVPEFAEAAYKLEPGQISDPVKTQFGWHVIKLDEKRPKVFPPLDQVREQVSRYVAQKAQSDLIVQLREGAKIERTEAPAEEKPAEKKPEEKKPAEKKK
ncbi:MULTISPECIES: peptidylprolyl isomerase [Methylosinus]|uniref:Parvulin-like PPIase n=1 Tax=Methylosinus trichosporium (strain ATCC 35070 / NCIMB 11131 / UNIQEM 75 / OB3b) TaxID=595536 RepID=A0A2D2D5S1_METT3|nr:MULTISPECIES: peptidylprolyl isomerase [Methylosinus]ATQ70370.1 peptidylprolyl isomerase [Methylosinus trichosporium OB3b]OBS53232.1 peptidylprolyl isomerase [Methylosinus sp. 3S-1]